MTQAPKKRPAEISDDSLDEKTEPNLSRLTQAGSPRIVRDPDLGSLQKLMHNPSITEIMVNDLRNVMVEIDGKMQPSGFSFSTHKELDRLIASLLDALGRSITPEHPYVDGVLPDGSRVNIVASPATLSGPCVTIRKFPTRTLTVEDLIASEMLDRRMAYFLNASVMGKTNILVSGGTGSGKTTLLNVLSSFIPATERIVTIEDTPELRISHINSVRLQTVGENTAHPTVSARDLVANALRMRPDRILVGECRRGEAFDMLQAMNTGHSGSMTTIHSNSPRDAIARLETLCLMGHVDLPLTAIRKQIASAVDLIVQIKRMRSGKRRITSIVEVTGMEGEVMTLQDLYSFEVDPASPPLAEQGVFKASGFVPTLLSRLREQGIEVPLQYFS